LLSSSFQPEVIYIEKVPPSEDSSHHPIVLLLWILERYPFKLIYFETAVHGKKFLFRGKCFPSDEELWI